MVDHTIHPLNSPICPHHDGTVLLLNFTVFNFTIFTYPEDVLILICMKYDEIGINL